MFGLFVRFTCKDEAAAEAYDKLVAETIEAIKTDDQISRLAAERTLHFKSDNAEGGVVFAAPLPGVYYKQWFLLTLLDRLIHRARAP